MLSTSWGSIITLAYRVKISMNIYAHSHRRPFQYKELQYKINILITVIDIKKKSNRPPWDTYALCVYLQICVSRSNY